MTAASIILVGRWDSPLQASVKPAVDLEQCANLGTTCDSTHASQWQTGNLGSSNSEYAEGESVPYRAMFTNLTSGKTYKAVLEWDSTKSGSHAIDYITSFDRTETTAAPCVGVTCSPGTATLPIPLDSRVSTAGVTQLGSQVISAFGATFPASGAVVANTGNLCGTASCTISSNPSAYSFAGTYATSSQTGISVYFTATGSTTVLAWGGHIASRMDWGAGKSAAAIPGSPYHMRILDLRCSNVEHCSAGNMDRSMSSAAVTIPSSITIVKQASPEGATQFSFTGSPAPLSNFTLTDDGTSANTRVFSGITAFGTYTVTEGTTAKWGLDRVSCSITNQTTGSTSVKGSAASITLGEGEDVTCTFFNSPLPAPALSLTKTADVENYSGVGQLITYTYVIKNTGNVAIGPVQFTIDDDKINGGAPFACGPAASTLAVEATLQCTAVYTTSSGDIDTSVTNTAFAAAGEVVSSSKQVTVPFVPTTTSSTTSTTTTTTTTTIAPAPALSLTKTADVENYSGVGQLITYTYVIKNTGNVAIGPVQFTIDDDKINGGAPFACGPAASTLAVEATLQCTAVYTTVTGDLEGSVTNTAFAAAGEVVSSSKQVTVPFVSTTTSSTTSTTTTTTTTTLAPTTTVAPTTTLPVELQVVTPDNPTGTEDVLDVLFPEDLPEAGTSLGLVSILAGVVLLGGVASMTVSSNRRSRRRTRGGK
jgi:hypothetical protein